ncbi:MAG TPA: NUDIX domain-containing protein, partial [Woeseiaceae bacterium]|nr:NUDIX domain-containing protein [Woeseiaceae bacterium]
YWSNSCCSHPRAGESMDEAIHRRAAEELGITSRFTFLFKFTYHARYGRVGAEHEVCSVFLGRSDDTVRCNRNEIASWSFVAPTALTRLLSAYPHWFTPWFRMEWQRIVNDHGDCLEASSDPRHVHTAETVRQET